MNLTGQSVLKEDKLTIALGLVHAMEYNLKDNWLSTLNKSILQKQIFSYGKEMI